MSALPVPPLLLADDLTGAADAALPFWRAGRRVWVQLDAAQPWPEGFDLVAVSSESRGGTGAQAEAAIRRLLPRLPAGRSLFKKVDSTLRGWIGAECRPLLETWPDLPVVFAPAYPEKGRVLGRDGVYRVGGVPLAETEFAAEIAGLPADSRLAGFLVHHFGAAAARLTVPAADTAGDLRAAVAAHPRAPVLWIGSAGLSEALAGSSPRPTPPAGPPPTRLPPARIVVAAGSRRGVVARQMSVLRAALPDDPALNDSLLLPPDVPFDPAASARIADELGLRAARRVHEVDAVGVVLTGGDTAAAACRHLGIAGGEIVAEVEPGMPVLRAGGRFLVTKAGGFGDDASLARAWLRIHSLLP
jgi:D-threonate/D-erythronate kinase